MKKTKIICTMGPNTENEDTLREMIIAGMDVARFNFSHGTHEEQLTKFNLLKKVREELNIPVAAMLDTKGPEIRTGKLVGGEPVCLEPGSEYTLTTREVIGDASVGHVTYDGLPEDVSEGDKILIDDGLIELTVLSIEDTDIRCRVYNGGMLGQQKGVNVPGVHVRLPDLTEQDQKDIVFAIEHDFDFIAASFVRSAECIHSIRRILNSFDSKIQIIAKIENQDGVEHLDEILEASDGIMVARGDMGVEIPPEDVPHVQKQMIARCNAVSKPVITATQMLDSMIRNPRPTRAEVADVANAIYDGTDVIMLSGESAVGKYPVEAVKMMVKIAETTEKFFDHAAYREKELGGGKLNITNTVCLSSVSAAAPAECEMYSCAHAFRIYLSDAVQVASGCRYCRSYSERPCASPDADSLGCASGEGAVAAFDGTVGTECREYGERARLRNQRRYCGYDHRRDQQCARRASARGRIYEHDACASD